MLRRAHSAGESHEAHKPETYKPMSRKRFLTIGGALALLFLVIGGGWAMVVTPSLSETLVNPRVVDCRVGVLRGKEADGTYPDNVKVLADPTQVGYDASGFYHTRT